MFCDTLNDVSLSFRTQHDERNKHFLHGDAAVLERIFVVAYVFVRVVVV